MASDGPSSRGFAFRFFFCPHFVSAQTEALKPPSLDCQALCYDPRTVALRGSVRTRFHIGFQPSPSLFPPPPCLVLFVMLQEGAVQAGVGEGSYSAGG